MLTNSNKIIVASVALGFAIALIWFRAPLLPAVLGAAGAGVLLYFLRRRRPTP